MLLLVLGAMHAEILYVVNSQSRTLSRIDTSTDQVNNTFASLGNVPNRVIIDEDYLWVVNSGDNVIQKLSQDTGATLSNIYLGNNVNPWDAIKHGDWLYATGLFSGKVYKVNALTGSVESSVNVGVAPEALQVMGDKLYVSCAGDYNQNYLGSEVAVIDLDTFSLVKTIPVSANPQYLEAYEDKLLVSCTGNWANMAGAICVIDTNSDTLIETLPLGGTPGRIMIVNPDLALVSDAGGEYLYSFSPFSHEIIQGAVNPILNGGSEVCGNQSLLAVLKPNWGDNGTVKILDHSYNTVKTYTVAMMPSDLKLQPKPTSNDDLVYEPKLMNVYPNPFKDQLSLQLDNKAPQRLQLAVYDIRGRLIHKEDLGYMQPGNQTIRWDGKNNPAGIYFLKIKGRETQITQKVIKM